MGKTVKEIAVENNVSKSYIDKIIRTLKMHTELDMVGNKYVISKTQEKAILKAVNKEKTTTKSTTKSHTKLDTEVVFLREQIERKNEEIRKMQQLLDQQQKLQLGTQKMLEEKTKLLELKTEKEQWWKFWK